MGQHFVLSFLLFFKVKYIQMYIYKETQHYKPIAKSIHRDQKRTRIVRE